MESFEGFAEAINNPLLLMITPYVNNSTPKPSFVLNNFGMSAWGTLSQYHYVTLLQTVLAVMMVPQNGATRQCQ